MLVFSWGGVVSQPRESFSLMSRGMIVTSTIGDVGPLLWTFTKLRKYRDQYFPGSGKFGIHADDEQLLLGLQFPVLSVLFLEDISPTIRI